ncbi:MAG: ketose-bisphosphate aldolase [Firmicutes bacterium]|nr:ketose-bisphosphate aldolase [Bacillota bacterium]
MQLVNTKEMLKRAYMGKYAIGAFNVCNMEIIQGISVACKETKSPVIFQISSGAKNYAGNKYLIEMVKIAVTEMEIEAALHLDHGNSFELCKDCIDSGFTSVMIDGSALSFEENIKLTSAVVEYARKYNVSVEAELGRLCGTEEHVPCAGKDSPFTDPLQVKEFVTKTGVDSLAIAIGTSHGINKFGPNTVPNLRFDILQKVNDILPDFPIVLHGASSIDQKTIKEIKAYGSNINFARGIPEKMLNEAAKMAVCKINIDSDLRLAITLAIKKFMNENPENFDPRSYFSASRNAVTYLVKNKIRNVLNCENTSKYLQK